MLNLTTDRQEASRGLFATAELLVIAHGAVFATSAGGCRPVTTICRCWKR